MELVRTLEARDKVDVILLNPPRSEGSDPSSWFPERMRLVTAPLVHVKPYQDPVHGSPLIQFVLVYHDTPAVEE